MPGKRRLLLIDSSDSARTILFKEMIEPGARTRHNCLRYRQGSNDGGKKV